MQVVGWGLGVDNGGEWLTVRGGRITLVAKSAVNLSYWSSSKSKSHQNYLKHMSYTRVSADLLGLTKINVQENNNMSSAVVK